MWLSAAVPVPPASSPEFVHDASSAGSHSAVERHVARPATRIWSAAVPAGWAMEMVAVPPEDLAPTAANSATPTAM